MISGTSKERQGQAMTKLDLIKQAAKASGATQETAAAVINAAIDAAADALLQGDAVIARGFGTLERRQHKARTAQAINGSGSITIPARYTIRFTAAQALKDRLNGEKGGNK